MGALALALTVSSDPFLPLPPSVAEFKTTDPVISTLLLALSPLLFIAIFQVSVAFVRTFTHKAPGRFLPLPFPPCPLFPPLPFVPSLPPLPPPASPPAVVHLYDVINFIALGSVVHAVFGYIGPLDAVIKAAGAELAKDASASVAKTQLADAVTKQSLPLLEVLVSNVIMLFLPLFRLKEANKAAQQQLGTAVGASKKDD